MNEMLTQFHFMRPLWLLAALPVLPAAWLAWRRMRSGQGWSAVISDKLLPHMLAQGGAEPSRWPVVMLLLAWLAAVGALAGPSWNKLPQPVERKEDALVVLYDLSSSMLAQDISPSRLVRSQQKLLDLLSRKTEGTMALVAYAGDAHVVSPLTDDLRTIANLLPALTPDIMPVAGSRPATAVAQAVQLLRDTGLEHGQILLLTDGIRERDVSAIERELAGSSYRLSVLGVGTEEGSPIPSPDGYLRDASGTIVIARLDRQPLRKLASKHKGIYSDLLLGDGDIEQLLQTDIWSELETEQLLGRSVDTWQDMGYWLLLLLVPVTLACFRRGWLLCLLLLPLPESAFALDWQDLFHNRDQRGSQLLQEGDASAAAETFRDPDWAAAANYQAGQYAPALEHYESGDSADSWYNRGNSLARSGKLPEAIDAYEQALQRQADMEDAAFNKQLLEQLLQQQQDQQDQQDQQSQQDQENQQDQQSQQRQQDQQGQQEQQEQQDQQSQQDQQGQQDQQDQQSQQEQQQAQQQAQQQEKQQQEQQARAEQQDEQEQSDQEQAPQQRDAEQMERDMANEQWLRRIPDDPSGLLRRKFRYESRQRAAQDMLDAQGYPGNRRNSDEPTW
ncbi:MAG: VWA domain-containing protein [Halieaceae bacterium]